MSTPQITTAEALRSALASTIACSAKELQEAVGQVVVATAAELPASAPAGADARSVKEAMDLSGFQPIEFAPRDGTKVIVACEGHPEFGAHLMGWSNARDRWEGFAFALLRKVPSWWDESQPQPTHFKIAN